MNERMNECVHYDRAVTLDEQTNKRERQRFREEQNTETETKINNKRDGGVAL